MKTSNPVLSRLGQAAERERTAGYNPAGPYGPAGAYPADRSRSAAWPRRESTGFVVFTVSSLP